MKVPIKAVPIIYSAPMVVARNQGLKSQTRRAVTFENSTVLGQTSRALWAKIDLELTETYRDAGPDPFGSGGYEYLHARVRPKLREEYGEFYRVRPRLDAGSILWTREGHTITAFKRLSMRPIYRLTGFYNADGVPFKICLTAEESEKFSRRKRKIGNIPPIFMYRSLCRGLDKVTRIRVQRLHMITQKDVRAEGLRKHKVKGLKIWVWTWPTSQIPDGSSNPVYAYQLLFELLNGPGSWKNQWVWIYEFKPYHPRRRPKRWLDRRRGAKK